MSVKKSSAVNDTPILVVDDFPTMRRILKSHLKDLGFNNVSEATDGQKAIAKLKENDFQLIISDWKMPNMMGIDLLKAVRADNRYKSVPFVMVTAESSEESMTEAMRAGATDYITKPLSVETLGKKIEAALLNR